MDTRDLIAQALDEFDQPDVPLSVTVRRCMRIATSLGDWRALSWLEMESHPTSVHTTGRSRLAADVAADLDLSSQESSERTLALREWMGRRRIDQTAESLVNPASVAEIEQHLNFMAGEMDAMRPAPGDSATTATDRTTARQKIEELVRPTAAIMERTRAHVFEYLLRVERTQAAGDLSQAIFERTRAAVDGSLAVISPEALSGFTAAYKRIDEGDPESLSHALTSARRVLKALADSVQPASDDPVEGGDGRIRELTDDKFVNRLIFYIERQGVGASARTVQTATLRDFGERLTALNALASKGVHSSVTAAEVELCVIQTYLMVGEVLRLAD